MAGKRKATRLLKESYPALLLMGVLTGWGITGQGRPEPKDPDYALRLLEWNPRKDLSAQPSRNLACENTVQAPGEDRAWCSAEDGKKLAQAAGDAPDF